jgi:hypothetical protein
MDWFRVNIILVCVVYLHSAGATPLTKAKLNERRLSAFVEFARNNILELYI